MMSLLVHPRHSVQLLQYVTRRFNGIIGFNLVVIKINSVEINFPLHQNSNESVMAILYTKLASSFKIINSRYLIENDHYRQVKVKFNQDSDFFTIKISGSLYVPTSKFLKLYNLILWYFIKYITGQKPSMSEKGETITEQWNSESKKIKKDINALPRKTNVGYNSHPCNICGKTTFRSNLWKFKSNNRLSSGIDIETFVCEKHKDKLIYHAMKTT